jgi:hypothetical protein
MLLMRRDRRLLRVRVGRQRAEDRFRFALESRHLTDADVDLVEHQTDVRFCV